MKGYYINLDNRTDRNSSILELKTKYSFFKDIERVSAIKDLNHGGMGCTKSHIYCLEKILNRDDESYYMIMEDDLSINSQKDFDDFVRAFEKIKDRDDWDLLSFTPSRVNKMEIYNNDFYRVENIETTTCYIVKKTFVKTLLDIFKESLSRWEEEGKYDRITYHKYALDQYWKKLQPTHCFLAYKLKVFGQIISYSDIIKRVVDYTQYM